jgi:hypothetical protein
MDTKIGILEISSNEQHIFLPLPIKVRRALNSSYPSEISDRALIEAPPPSSTPLNASSKSVGR